MKGACISRSAQIVVMFLICMCAKAQVLERLDLGINAKNDFISPVVSYQLQEKATLEFTLPYNFKLTP